MVISSSLPTALQPPVSMPDSDILTLSDILTPNGSPEAAPAGPFFRRQALELLSLRPADGMRPRRCLTVIEEGRPCSPGRCKEGGIMRCHLFIYYKRI